MQRRVLVSITFTFDGFDGDENFSFRILLVEVLCFGKARVIDAGETEGKDLVNRITRSTPELVQCKLLVYSSRSRLQIHDLRTLNYFSPKD